MKQILLIIFLFPLFPSMAQESIPRDILETDSIRHGIYENYEQFRTNSPGREGEIHFYKAGAKAISKGAKPSFMVYTDPNTERRDTIEQGIWGFSINNKVYRLIEGDTLNPSYYLEIGYLGRYCFYEDHVILSIDAGGLLTANPGMKRERVFSYIININNGKEFKVNDKLMHSILNDDKDLLVRYKAEKKRKALYGQYIEMYSEEHQDQIK